MKVLFRLLLQSRVAHSTRMSGFSLPELLVATLIAALIAAATAQVMISQVLEERRLAVAQALREDISRLNYLIQIEASDAESVEVGGANPTGCPGGGESFTFVIPQPEGTYATVGNRSRIQYYNADDEDDDDNPAIWRCGPSVSRNGVLLHGEDNTIGIVMRNAQLDRDPGDGCPVSSPRSVTYRVLPPVGLQGANLGDLGGCVTAHARSVFVCNPAIDASQPCSERVGDCDCL